MASAVATTPSHRTAARSRACARLDPAAVTIMRLALAGHRGSIGDTLDRELVLAAGVGGLHPKHADVELVGPGDVVLVQGRVGHVSGPRAVVVEPSFAPLR